VIGVKFDENVIYHLLSFPSIPFTCLLDIIISLKIKQLVVVLVAENSQGARNGIRIGDKLVGVNGEPIPGDLSGFV